MLNFSRKPFGIFYFKSFQELGEMVRCPDQCKSIPESATEEDIEGIENLTILYTSWQH